MANRHGGARPGAGRKPKALMYGEQGQALEQKILDALPQIIDKLIEMAKDGDVRAARYLVDRILGRVSRLPSPPVEDRTLPYTEADLEKDSYFHERKIELFHWEREEHAKPREPLRFKGTTLADLVEANAKDRHPPGPFSLKEALYQELARREAESKAAAR